MANTPLEFSTGGEFLINSSHDGVLKVWETSTNKLRNEYKPSSHLSASCSCLSWCQKRTDLSNGTPKTKRRKSGNRNVISAIYELNLVAIGTVSGTVLLYSMVKGDLHSQLVEGHADRVNGISWFEDQNTLYSCSSDQHIVEWEVTTTKLKSKWKADKGAVHSLCRCSNKHLLSAGRKIKLWDLTSKTVIKEFTGHATEVFRMLHIPTSTDGSIENSYFLSAAVNDRLVHAWHINTSSPDKNALAAFSMPDEPVSLQVSSHIKHKPIVIVVVTKCGKALLFEHTLNGKLKTPLLPKLTIQIASECGKGEVPHPIQILSTFICDETQHKLLLVHGNTLKPTFEKVSYATSESDMCLVRQDPMKTVLKKDSSVSKVKTPDISKDMTVLVPGHMASGSAARRKRKTSVGEMTMEERLNAISLDKPKTGDSRQAPKADTLATLLMQGLQSQDHTILNKVLQNRNTTLIKNTVKKLHVQMIIPLVQELTKRMHGHGQSGTTQVLWIKTVLAVHTSYLMTFPEIIDTFSSLYQMMDSRVEVFGKLSRLQGKLDIMLSQISTQTQEDEPVTSQPLLQYEEESSDDDLEELAIGPDASDSEPDNWEDFSDDDSDMEVTQNDVNSKG